MFDVGVFINERKSVFTDEGISGLEMQGVNKIGLAWELLASCECGGNQDFRWISKRLRESGIDFYTVTVPKGWGRQPFSITNENEEQRYAFLEWMQKLIGIVGACGAKIVPVYTSGACLPYSRRTCTESALDFINRLIPSAKDAGVRLALVNAKEPLI